MSSAYNRSRKQNLILVHYQLSHGETRPSYEYHSYASSPVGPGQILKDVYGILRLSDEVLVQKIFAQLTPRDVSSIALVCRRFYKLTKNTHLWRLVCRNAWGTETTAIIERVHNPINIDWGRLAREVTTLEAAAWRKLKVEGAVEPSRCNFSACAVGNKVALFGGEGVNMQPMNDTFVLDLSAARPECCHVDVSSAPPGRWGHTLSCLNGSWLVVFGGCGRQGLLNDVFVLDLDAKQPTWREVGHPVPRSWHSSCTLEGTQLVVYGGCADSGVPLSDTYLLDISKEKPMWQEIPVSWTPPSRLGHTLSAYTWSSLGGGGVLPPTLAPPGKVLPVKYFHVGSTSPAVTLPGGRILIFGGSIAGLHSASQIYLLDPGEEKPGMDRSQSLQGATMHVL